MSTQETITVRVDQAAVEAVRELDEVQLAADALVVAVGAMHLHGVDRGSIFHSVSEILESWEALQ